MWCFPTSKKTNRCTHVLLVVSLKNIKNKIENQPSIHLLKKIKKNTSLLPKPDTPFDHMHTDTSLWSTSPRYPHLSPRAQYHRARWRVDFFSPGQIDDGVAALLLPWPDRRRGERPTSLFLPPAAAASTPAVGARDLRKVSSNPPPRPPASACLLCAREVGRACSVPDPPFPAPRRVSCSGCHAVPRCRPARPPGPPGLSFVDLDPDPVPAPAWGVVGFGSHRSGAAVPPAICWAAARNQNLAIVLASRSNRACCYSSPDHKIQFAACAQFEADYPHQSIALDPALLFPVEKNLIPYPPPTTTRWPPCLLFQAIDLYYQIVSTS